MLIRSLLWGLGIAGTLTLTAFLLVLFFFDPFSTGGIGLTLFLLVSLLHFLWRWFFWRYVFVACVLFANMTGLFRWKKRPHFSNLSAPISAVHLCRYRASTPASFSGFKLVEYLTGFARSDSSGKLCPS